ncbi:3-dehydroquinate synthase [Yunchengibacter salinarum]|uniref:3-dehydroquinate synthase n=1 Tax=Yunchengibacter salinarum TaxID=3133399 RepID=UPI0035B63B1A
MSDTPSCVLETVPVALGARTYDIRIGTGLIDNLGAEIGDLLPRKRTAIITDETVAALYEQRAVAGLEAAGITVHTLKVPPGEGSKSITMLDRLCGDLLATGLERSDMVIALGGGVVGDLAGFAAAILRRGMDFIQVPTTLLAQVDSSVGGKTGINTGHGKNLLGAFHQPRRVLIDLAALDTLPDRERRAGYAEVVKYGLIDDPEFFRWLEDHGPALLAGDRPAARHAIATSCRAKARTVAEDEREGGKRALLNLGHTFGHALEAEAGYDGSLLHGEAVAIGMVLALDLSVRLGLATPAERNRVAAHLAATGLPTSPATLNRPLTVDRLMAHMAQDKKVSGGKLVLILGPIGGAAIHRDVDPEDVRAVWAAALAGDGAGVAS